MSSFKKLNSLQINRLQAFYRGVGANVEATLMHLDKLLTVDSNNLAASQLVDLFRA